MANITGSPGDDTITPSTNSTGGSLATASGDSIAGLDGNDRLEGGDGSDTLRGDAGADTLDGGAGGFDVASYRSAAAPVLVSLADPGSSAGEAAGDLLLGIERIIGGSFADTLIASAAGLTLDGAESDDSLHGGAAADSLFGGLGNDTVAAGPGGDTVRGAEGDDLLLANLDVPFAGLNELLSGGDGQDTLSFEGAVSLLDNGLGYSPVVRWSVSLPDGTIFAQTADGRFGAAGVIGMSLTSPSISTFEEVIGSAVADTMLGDTADNRLRGAAGDDTLEGNAGRDTLEGGSGADLLRAFGTAVLVSHRNASEGVRAFLDDTPGNTGDAAGDTFEIAGSRSIEGSRHADTLRGDALDNLVLGLDGDDHLQAQSPDTLSGQSGDTLDGGNGADTYVYAAGTTILDSGTDGARDTLRTAIGFIELRPAIEDLELLGSLRLGIGNTADNRIVGNAQNNVLDGGEGADTLDGGIGNDVLVGGFGRDVFIVDSRYDTAVDEPDAPGQVIASVGWRLGEFFADLTLTSAAGIQGIGNALGNIILGNSGSNALNGDAGADTLLGANGNDSLLGRADADLLRGDAGGDRLSGDDGADTLDGGEGPDTLRGGAGTDAFLLAHAPTTADRISDYAPGERITIALAAFDPGGMSGLVAGALAAQPGRYATNLSGVAATPVVRFLYETDSGRLYFDIDGNGPDPGILVATLADAPPLSAGDIVLA